MFLVASIKPRDEPRTTSASASDQVLAEADDIVVSALFDDIVRQLLTPVDAREPEPDAWSAHADESEDGYSIWTPPPRVHPGRSRSPPQT
ncbi:hypothetical protein [Agreia sp. VKM Ac-1783]|uniref:hypothetical protein n=1 Tax=Agreia sp. VKM Ac-1783 TaxID=1938889 RepID=UPI000A2ADB9B|nr:hypothetical protein [Agreia sp. VKM Ac-1783]SMQ74843.1 hypothetical protein SAMN06295943_3238 [Agreia sp. VKM Ac-1783]